MDLIDGLRAFVATARSGSFTQAAEQMGISNRLTSKYVAELEARLGVRLLQRTTRQVGLTSAGQDLLSRAPALLDEVDDMLGAVSGAAGLSGVLRVAAPLTFGEVYIKDLLGRFVDHHPELAIDLRLSDDFVDLAAGGFDLAFRVTEPDVASLKVRKLGKVSFLVVASPDYLAQRGSPRSPEDLMEHRCILDTNRRDSLRWTFGRGAMETVVTPAKKLMVNNPRVARDWAIRGMGIALCPDFVLHGDLEAGRLVSLLEGYSLPGYPICAVYLEGAVLPRKVRTLIDFALEDARESGFA